MRIYSTQPDEIKKILESNGYEDIEVIELTENNLDEPSNEDVIVFVNSMYEDTLYEALLNRRIKNLQNENELKIPLVVNYSGKLPDESEEEFIEDDSNINIGYFLTNKTEDINKKLFENLNLLKNLFLYDYIEAVKELTDRIKASKELNKLANIPDALTVRKVESTEKFRIEPLTSIYKNEWMGVYKMDISNEEVALFPIILTTKKLIYNGEIYSPDPENPKDNIFKNIKDKTENIFPEEEITEKLYEKLTGNEALIEQNTKNEKKEVKVQIELKSGAKIIYSVKDISRNSYIVFEKENKLLIEERECCVEKDKDCAIYGFKIPKFSPFVFVEKDKDLKEFLEFLYEKINNKIDFFDLIKFFQNMLFNSSTKGKINIQGNHNVIKALIELKQSYNLIKFDEFIRNIAKNISQKFNLRDQEVKENIYDLLFPYYNLEKQDLNSLEKNSLLLKVYIEYLCNKKLNCNKPIEDIIKEIPNFAKKLENYINSSIYQRGTWKHSNFFLVSKYSENINYEIYDVSNRDKEKSPVEKSLSKKDYRESVRNLLFETINYIIKRRNFKAMQLIVILSLPLDKKLIFQKVNLKEKEKIEVKNLTQTLGIDNLYKYKIKENSLEDIIKIVNPPLPPDKILEICKHLTISLNKEENLLYHLSYLETYYHLIDNILPEEDKEIFYKMMIKIISSTSIEKSTNYLLKYTEAFDELIDCFYFDDNIVDKNDAVNRAVLIYWGYALGLKLIDAFETAVKYFKEPQIPYKIEKDESIYKNIYEKYKQAYSRLITPEVEGYILARNLCKGTIDTNFLTSIGIPVVIYNNDNGEINYFEVYYNEHPIEFVFDASSKKLLIKQKTPKNEEKKIEIFLENDNSYTLFKDGNLKAYLYFCPNYYSLEDYKNKKIILILSYYKPKKEKEEQKK